MNTQPRVAIVEDEPGTRRRVVTALREGGLEVVGEFASGLSAMGWLAHGQPDVLLCDLGLPDVSGLEVIAYCARHHPATLVMVITMFEDEQHVIRSLEAGAHGYLLKDSLGDEIVTRVRELAQGGSPITPVIARLLLARFRSASLAGVSSTATPVADAAEGNLLTGKERTVLTRIAQGFSYAEIASLEGVSRNTVATHIRNIYGKLNVHSKNEAVFEASKLGLIKPF